MQRPQKLSDGTVELRVLQASDVDELLLALSDGNISGQWAARVPAPSNLSSVVANRIELAAKGEMYTFTVRDAKLGICGMTSIYDIDRDNLNAKVGFTWYSKSAQGTQVNKRSKRLLFEFLFENARLNAVYLTTHRLNFASRRAIESLGAQLDGIIRGHMVHTDGSIRDTCWYSIQSSEWPAVKNYISSRIEIEH